MPRIGKYKTTDHTGKKFGRLTVIKKILRSESGDKYNMYLCKCDCGKETKTRSCNLVGKITQSCGCLNRETFAKYGEKRGSKHIGKKYGRLMVLERVKTNINKRHTVLYKCKCDCGKEVMVSCGSFSQGNTKSCGCLNIDQIIARNKDPELISKRKGKGYKLYRAFHWKTTQLLHCRSSYEYAVVRYLNKNNIDFLWQIPFTLQDGRTYIVDLYLVSEDKYVEIKGYWWSDGLEKWNLFQDLVKTETELWDFKKLKEMNIITNPKGYFK